MPLGLDKGNVGGLSGVTVKPSYMWLFNLHEDPQEEDNAFIRHLWNQHLFNSELAVAREDVTSGSSAGLRLGAFPQGRLRPN